MSCRLSVISVFILSSVPLSRLEKSSSHFAFPLADLKSVSGLISFIKEHELLKAQEAAKSRPYSAFVTLPWPLGLEGAVPLHGATSRRSGSMLLWAGRLLRFRGKASPFIAGNWEGFLERFLFAVRTGLPAAGLLSDHWLDCSDHAGAVGSGDGGSARLLFSVQR